LEALLKKVAEQAFAEGAVAEFKCNAQALVDKHATGNGFKQSVTMKHLGLDVQVAVSSGTQLWELLYWQALRDKALGRQDGLPLLRFEQLVLSDKYAKGNCNIPGVVLQELVGVRKAATSIFESLGEQHCFQDVKRVLGKNQQALLSLSRSWKVEQAWVCEHGSAALLKYCHARVLDVLPTETQLYSLTQAVASLQALVKDADIVHCGGPCVAMVQAALELLCELQRGVAARAELLKDEFWHEVLQRLLWFVEAVEKKDGVDTKLRGMAALMA